MNTKLYLFLFILMPYVPTRSMEKYLLKRSLPDGIELKVEDIWLNIIARCSAKWKLRETCTYFRDFASITNDKIFLQNPLIIEPDLLKEHALYHAELNHGAIITNLLNQGLDPNMLDSDKHLIDYAVLNENLDLIKLLTKHPKYIIYDLKHPFSLALQRGLLEAAKYMLTIDTIDILMPTYHKHISDQNTTVLMHILSLKNDTFTTSQLLLTAALKGQVKIARILLDHNADVNGVSAGRKTPLRQALNHLLMLELLIEHGANIENINKYNETLLETAVQYGAMKNIQFLINHGASLTTRPGKEPLIIYAILNRCIQPIKLLLNKGVDVNERSTEGCAPLSVAVRNHCTASIPLLLAHPDIDVNVTVNDETPLDIAIRNLDRGIIFNKSMLSECNDIINLLTEHGGKTSAELAQLDEQK